MSPDREDEDLAGKSGGVGCILSLGSNLGDRRGHLTLAIQRLAGTPVLAVESISRVVESEPWGPVAQGRFLNVVLGCRSATGAMELLRLVQGIETDGGRERVVRYGPRTLDIDIIFFGDLVLESSALTLPHPFWRERPFVHDLLGDLPPGTMREFLIHPGVAEALRAERQLSPELTVVDPLDLPGVTLRTGHSI